MSIILKFPVFFINIKNLTAASVYKYRDVMFNLASSEPCLYFDLDKQKVVLGVVLPLNIYLILGRLNQYKSLFQLFTQFQMCPGFRQISSACISPNLIKSEPGFQLLRQLLGFELITSRQ